MSGTRAAGSAAWAYTLLVFATLCWGANAIAGKLAIGQVSPMALTTLRWLVACAVLLPMAWQRAAGEWRLLLPSWNRIALMGSCGFTAFNALFYAAAGFTTATNLALIQGSIPVIVLLFSFLLYRTPIRPAQIAGVFLTLLGVAVVASHGDLAVFTSLAFNRGDLFVLIASVFYAGYTVGLRERPPVAPLTFFAAMAFVAFATSLPLLAIEWWQGRTTWPTPTGWMVVIFVGLLPSLFSQLAYIRGVALIGPNRAGTFVNLLPVFGALLAVVVLREPLRASTALALALVVGGIFIAERGRAR